MGNSPLLTVVFPTCLLLISLILPAVATFVPCLLVFGFLLHVLLINPYCYQFSLRVDYNVFLSFEYFVISKVLFGPLPIVAIPVLADHCFVLVFLLFVFLHSFFL